MAWIGEHSQYLTHLLGIQRVMTGYKCLFDCCQQALCPICGTAKKSVGVTNESCQLYYFKIHSFLRAVSIIFLRVLSLFLCVCAILCLTWLSCFLILRWPQEIFQLFSADGHLLRDQPSLEVFNSTVEGRYTKVKGIRIGMDPLEYTIRTWFNSASVGSWIKCIWYLSFPSYLSSMSPPWKSSEVWASWRNLSQHSFFAWDNERNMSLEVTSLDWPFSFFRRFSAPKGEQK